MYAHLGGIDGDHLLRNAAGSTTKPSAESCAQQRFTRRNVCRDQDFTISNGDHRNVGCANCMCTSRIWDQSAEHELTIGTERHLSVTQLRKGSLDPARTFGNECLHLSACAHFT